MRVGAAPRGEYARKGRIADLYRDVIAAGRLERLAELAAAAYTPHVPAFRGIEQLESGLDALEARLRRVGRIPNRVVRLIVDGDWAFAHVHWDGPLSVAGVDVFRFDSDDRIAAHWNVRQPLSGTRAQVEERFSSTVASDAGPAPEPARLRARVCEMLTELWSKGNADLVADFYAESYVQHNADMPGGYSRIKEIVGNEIRRYIETTGGPFPVDVHHIGAEGDIVFVHLSLFMAGINRNDGDRSTNVDVFRVDRHGRMVEHWDVLQIEGVALPTTTVF